MDVFAHGLWSAAAAEAVNKRHPKTMSVGWTAWWGIFPDIFAFTPVFIWLTIERLRKKTKIPFKPGQEYQQIKSLYPIFRITEKLYDVSHSLVVFFFVFFFRVALNYTFLTPVYGLPLVPWEMLAWLGHIACDIPTHSLNFYPTPLFWPISKWKFNGMPWSTPWFMVTNYTALFIVYFFLLS